MSTLHFLEGYWAKVSRRHGERPKHGNFHALNMTQTCWKKMHGPASTFAPPSSQGQKHPKHEPHMIIRPLQTCTDQTGAIIFLEVPCSSSKLAITEDRIWRFPKMEVPPNPPFL